ncbi:MAG: hypothetical protein SNJ82_06710 [Gemmataceae bacterium]
MSQLNNRPHPLFRTKLKDWQAAFRARKAQLAAILGEDPPSDTSAAASSLPAGSSAGNAPAALPVIREKKMANRKRVRTRS